METIAFAASIARFAETAAMLFTSLYKFSKRVNTAPQHAKDLEREVLLVQDILEGLQRTVSSLDVSASTTLQALVQELGVTFQDMRTKIEASEKDVAKTVRWPFTQKENDAFLSQLERFKATAVLLLNAPQMSSQPSDRGLITIGHYWKRLTRMFGQLIKSYPM